MPGLPYEPIPQELYTRDKLFQDFKSDDSASWGQTKDFIIYKHFVMEGRSTPTNPYMGMMQALHDNAITQSTRSFIADRKVAAIMGDHKMARDSTAYRDIAILSRRLTRSGILMCTGGGPGAMEASHLGASLAAEVDSHLDSALSLLKVQPTVPELGDIVNTEGVVNLALVAQAHAWFKPAHEIAASIHSPNESLAVPTWDYGHEPATPFATHIAKYFQNSLREDGLLALAKQGIVYSEGKAGTIQEIFEDSTQNYYKTFDYFSPMVLLGVQYWTTKYPVVGVLQKLFKSNDFKNYVLVTDDVEAAAQFIIQFNHRTG
jgi:predicted Rossmann-fold nucleotide-binding protein